MTTDAPSFTPEQAHEIVCDLHKRAFLGRLEQLGETPSTQKEAHALLDLGIALYDNNINGVKEASAGNVYGDGPYARVLDAFLGQSEPVAPGFEGLGKQASSMFDATAADLPQLPQQLLDGAAFAAQQLAQQPEYYEAACIKRAYLEELAAEALSEE